MTLHGKSGLLEKLVRDFDLNPVYNKNGQLLIGSLDVERVFGISNVWFEIHKIQCREKFKTIFFNQFQFPRPGKSYKDYYYYHMTIPGLFLILKEFEHSDLITQRFYKKIVVAVEKQNQLLKDKEYILRRASEIQLERAIKKARLLAV